MNLDDIAAAMPAAPKHHNPTFKEYIKNTFGIDMPPEMTDDATQFTIPFGGINLLFVGTHAAQGWRFSINGNNFSARGDMPKLPVEQRQQELITFIRKTIGG
jgi:hypothetical protein